VVEINVLTVLKERQCTIKVTMNRLRVTIIFVHKQELLYILSVCL